MSRPLISREDLDDIVSRMSRIANAIAADAAPGHDESGGTVTSLTEAVMGTTAGLYAIAEAISDLAEAIREGK